ncbi:MAG: riboflavin synthase [Betaproteobacteria bacterium]|jgi:riboflavin synthase|nr:riboflavin synthase [Betaproteobacteria bacterium]
MFSGIVAAVGHIEQIEPLGDGLRLTVETGGLDLDGVALGDSIANSGVCLTVIALDGNRVKFDVSRETLNCSVGLDRVGSALNLEKALALNGLIGGHLVTGHVDGIGEIMNFAPLAESFELAVRAPDSIAGYIARKGSVTVNGVSLTVNDVHGRDFSINLIPHTIAVTNFKHLKTGDKVNLEIDLIARYVERMMAWREEQDAENAV